MCLCMQASLDRPAIGCYREVLKTCPLSLEAAQALMLLSVKGLEIQELILETTSGEFCDIFKFGRLISHD